MTRRHDAASDVWRMMASLVINNERKREVCDKTGLSFAKTRALRRIADHPLSMGELAALLTMEPPNVTTLIDDLQRSGLVQRRPHASDRRVMLVEITAAGSKLARLAQEILDQPPEGLAGLSPLDLEVLKGILSQVR